MTNLVRNFNELNKNDVAIAGGKGASLGEMMRAGIPVPNGFVILSSAFEKFLEKTDLNVEIDSILDSVNHKEVHTIETASGKIKALILQAEMPHNIAIEIQKFFKNLNSKYVAVRSSATAEDSASAAWAGQLESYLNTTEENLLENVKKCWASLFTPRAIFYRFEKDLHKQKISVAVVVQKMVESEKSGIAFSVHPVTQDANQLIIEAGLGLGEAIVSGQITPNSYVIAKEPRQIIDTNIVAQTKGLYRAKIGSNKWRDIPEEKGTKQVLSETEILELSELVLNIEKHYGFPCDIEWAYEKGTFYITQSRPITTITSERLPMEVVDRFERVFGGPNMPFLVSDIVTDVYTPRHGFLVLKTDNVWTCYIPLKQKKEALEDGRRLYSHADTFQKYKSDFSKFIDHYDKSFNAIFKNEDNITSQEFENFILLCKEAEIFYSYTQYFFTDHVSFTSNDELEFGKLKERGRGLLNDQYFSKDSHLEKVLQRVSETTLINQEQLYNYSWSVLDPVC